MHSTIVIQTRRPRGVAWTSRESDCGIEIIGSGPRHSFLLTLFPYLESRSSRYRSRSFANSARRTTTGPVDTQMPRYVNDNLC